MQESSLYLTLSFHFRIPCVFVFTALSRLFENQPVGMFSAKTGACADFVDHVCTSKFLNADINRRPFRYQSIHFLVANLMRYIKGDLVTFLFSNFNTFDRYTRVHVWESQHCTPLSFPLANHERFPLEKGSAHALPASATAMRR